MPLAPTSAGPRFPLPSPPRPTRGPPSPGALRTLAAPAGTALLVPGAAAILLACLASFMAAQAGLAGPGLAGATLLCAMALTSLAHGAALQRRRLRRLADLGAVMMAMARREAAGPIPSLTDNDMVGEMARALAIFRGDAHEVELRGAELEDTLHRLDAAISHMVHGLIMLDTGHRVVLCNQRLRDLFGLDADIVRPGARLEHVLAHSVAVGNHPGATVAGVLASMQSRIATGGSAAFQQRLPDGRTLSVNWTPIQGGGWVGTYEDITAREAARDCVVHMARHDALTGLPNRLVLEEQLAASCAQGGFDLLCIAIDRLDTVFKTRGHTAGDALLGQAAARLRQCVRDTDFAAHLGGAGFAVLRRGAPSVEAAAQLAARLLETLGSPYDIEGGDTIVSVCIGIAHAADAHASAEDLLRNATLAMHRARADGGDCWHFYAPDMDRTAQDRASLERDLRGALDAGQFEIYYQPLVSVMQRRVTGFEALLRWHHPQRGMVSPAEFIPLAEELGLIGAIGDWVLRTACAEATTWPADVRVAVNLSPRQFASATAKAALARSVTEALETSGLSGDRLELEITESVRLQDDSATLSLLHTLRSLGARISLDDFGTGYSSLSYLRSFPFDKIKIDQSFIRSLPATDCSAIVRAIATLGASLGIATTAEGVETRDQLDALVHDGCNEMQGYLFSPPRPAREVPGLLASVSDKALAA